MLNSERSDGSEIYGNIDQQMNKQHQNSRVREISSIKTSRGYSLTKQKPYDDLQDKKTKRRFTNQEIAGPT